MSKMIHTKLFKNIKEKKKYIVISLVGIFLIVFMFYAYKDLSAGQDTKNDKTQETSKTTDNKKSEKADKNKEINNSINEIKKIVTTSDTAVTSNDMNTIDNFIDENKNEDRVKGELKDFIITQANQYINSKSNNTNLCSRIKYAILRLAIDYPDDNNVQGLHDKFYPSDTQNNASNSNQQQQTQTQQTNNLTSSDGNLELLDKGNENGDITGTIKNKSSDTYSYVEVDINLYDAQDNQIDSTMANINNMQGNSNWKFKAPVINQDKVKKYRIIKITGTKN